MLQAYSNNLTLESNEVFSFNSVAIQKGSTAVLASDSSIYLNKRGIYMVSFDAFAAPSAATGTVSVQLMVNGVAQPQAISSFEADAEGATQAMHFETLVQVTTDNCPCNTLSSPTVLQVMNAGIAVEGVHGNIVVTKLN